MAAEDHDKAVVLMSGVRRIPATLRQLSASRLQVARAAGPLRVQAFRVWGFRIRGYNGFASRHLLEYNLNF